MTNRVGELVAVLAFGLSAIGIAVSMATIIFTGELVEGLPRAIGSFCIAGGVYAIAIALRSQFVPAAGLVQDAPAIVLVAVAAAYAQRPGVELGDVFVLIMVTSAVTGLAMFFVGQLRLGSLVRYIPTTVIAAFVAGTGWLLLKGGLDVMVGRGVSLSDLGDLFTGDLLKFWLPGAVLGVVAWLVSQSDNLPVSAVGATIAASLASFYGIVAAVSSVDEVEEGGWLIGPFPSETSLSVVGPSDLADASWGELASQVPGILSVIAISVIVMLLNLTGISAHVGTRADADHELRFTGITNVVLSPFGASPGFHGLGDTVLLTSIGAASRAVPALAGVLMVGFGALGVGLIGYVPRFVIGALLITVGVGLFDEWFRGLRQSITWVERILSIGIVLVIAWVGVLEGIGAGLVAACAVFIVRYSRVDPVRLVEDASALRSRVDRSPKQQEALAERSDRLMVYHLQGYLFFGSLTQIEDRFSTVGEIDVVILDFAGVTGIDTSGYALIARLVAQLRLAGVVVVSSGMDADLRDSLVAAEATVGESVVWADSLDEALEVAEEAQLARIGDLDIALSLIHLSEELQAHFEVQTFEPDEIVLQQGDEADAEGLDGMFIIRDGEMTAYRVHADGTRHRLRRFGMNAMIGEIALITGGARTATVIADTYAEVLWLAEDVYRELRTDHPELIFELHELVMRTQSARVISLTEALTSRTE